MNAVEELDFNLAYYDVIVQYIRYYATGNSPPHNDLSDLTFKRKGLKEGITALNRYDQEILLPNPKLYPNVMNCN